MSTMPPNQRSLRRRWFLVLSIPIASLLLLFGLVWALRAARGSGESVTAWPVGEAAAAPTAQTSHADVRFEVRYRSDDARNSTSVAWGDYDGDGDLDLAVGNGRYGSSNQSNQLFQNDGSGRFREWDLDQEGRDTRAVGWGDMDGDGDLDLVVANYDARNQIFENTGGQLLWDEDQGLGWQSVDVAPSTSLALGDYDGDGDLDLFVGNQNEPNQLFRNISGTLRLRWQAPAVDAAETRAVAWGDVDGDGDLDLAVGNHDSVDRVYENVDGRLHYDPSKGTGWELANGADLEIASEPCSAMFTPGFVDQRFALRTRALSWGDWDKDGDLDLAVGGGSDEGNLCGAFIYVYENVDGELLLNGEHGWMWQDSTSMDKPASLTWGDWDGDGDLDLVAGLNAGSGFGRQNRVYENDGGQLRFDPGQGFGWQSTQDADLDSETTYGVALGDADGDGDLDLAVGNGGRRNGGERNLIMRNATPVILLGPQPWTSPDSRRSTSSAWGDWDGDGDLDLAVGNMGEPNQVYENVDGVLQFDPANGLGWESTAISMTTSVAWGDWDDDGDLDLAVGNDGERDLVYENTGTTLTLTAEAGWISPLISDTQSLAWGDWDRDNDLDLAVGHCGQNEDGPVPEPAVVYENDGTTLVLNSGDVARMGWVSPEPLCANAVSWGDWDNDADLDLAVGARVYENIGGRLLLNPRANAGWIGDVEATSVAWGDVDGDGDLDLAVGTQLENRVYENLGGDLYFAPDRGFGWESRDRKQTTGLAWGDVDGDEDLDLAVANAADWRFQANQVFENVDGQLSASAAWETVSAGNAPDQLMRSHSVAWGDVDHDGDLDLAITNFCSDAEAECDPEGRPNQLFMNELQGFDMPGSGVPRLSLEEPSRTASANFYASPDVLTSNVITLPYVIRDPQEQSVGRVELFFSLDGGDNWKPAVATSSTITTNLATSASGVRHEFVWDTFRSGFFGKSDNVAIRMIAYDTPPANAELVDGSYRYYDGVAGSFQRPFVTATSFPFRVQSTQVRVVDGDNGDAPVEGAWVFRLPNAQVAGAEPMPDPEQPLPTDSEGYLPGGGSLSRGDRLVALRPIDTSQFVTFTNKIRLFYTSGQPTESGLAMREFRDPGEVVLAVSADNPLLLFDVDIALEWDARNDELFRSELMDGIQHASELLFDVTNGQAALGQVRVFQGKEYWPYADVVVQANNAMRPSAAIGGITQVPLSETVRTGPTATKVVTNAYTNNQIRMGTVWDPFGEYTADLGPDWWQAL
ncbi:MAG: FG-GAP repeat domain-containing protein, partial [Candidatus Promineifilaceae bacterium]